MDLIDDGFDFDLINYLISEDDKPSASNENIADFDVDMLGSCKLYPDLLESELGDSTIGRGCSDIPFNSQPNGSCNQVNVSETSAKNCLPSRLPDVVASAETCIEKAKSTEINEIENCLIPKNILLKASKRKRFKGTCVTKRIVPSLKAKAASRSKAIFSELPKSPRSNDLNRNVIMDPEHNELIGCYVYVNSDDYNTLDCRDCCRRSMPPPLLPRMYEPSSNEVENSSTVWNRHGRDEQTDLQIHYRQKYMAILNDRLNAVYSLPAPDREAVMALGPEQVTDEEMALLPEFFRDANTMSRYLKIRSSFISLWKEMRPKYVCKTAVRSVLKNCGDVHLLRRAHLYLERKGYINYGAVKADIAENSSAVAVKYAVPTSDQLPTRILVR